MRKRNLPNRHASGFTLLELMIVLVILVGLMAIAGPRLLGSQKKADINQAKVQIGQFERGLKDYLVDMKVYPPTEEGLKVLLSAPEDERLARRWSGPYLDAKSLPLDPWGNEYQYEFDSMESSEEQSTEGSPRIFSMGPDGQPGTADDVANRAADGEESTTEEGASRKSSNR